MERSDCLVRKVVRMEQSDWLVRKVVRMERSDWLVRKVVRMERYDWMVRLLGPGRSNPIGCPVDLSSSAFAGLHVLRNLPVVE